MKSNIPLVRFNVTAPNFLQFIIKSRNWLVDVELTEMLFSELLVKKRVRERGYH